MDDNRSLPVELYDRIYEVSEFLLQHVMIIFTA